MKAALQQHNSLIDPINQLAQQDCCERFGNDLTKSIDDRNAGLTLIAGMLDPIGIPQCATTIELGCSKKGYEELKLFDEEVTAALDYPDLTTTMQSTISPQVR